MNVEQRLFILSQTLLATTLYVILLDIILPMGNLRPSRQDEIPKNSPLYSCLTVIRRYFLASKCSNWDPNAPTDTAKSWQLRNTRTTLKCSVPLSIYRTYPYTGNIVSSLTLIISLNCHHLALYLDFFKPSTGWSIQVLTKRNTREH